ncbi:MAG: beta-ketoacyl synthase N-terminal-like domain-containing protein [Acidobacteriota bacterium]
MRRRTVIAGWGYVGPTGAGPGAARAAFEEGELPLTEVDRSGGYHRDLPDGRGSRHAALVPKEALAGLIPPRKLRRMSPPSRFAVAATKQAASKWLGADAAAAEAGGEPPPLTAVVSSTGFGPSSYTEELLRQIFLDQPTSASPFLFTEAVANAPAAQAALELRATGPNITITQREVGPLLAMGRARRLLEAGRVGRALVVAVDEVNPLLHAALDRFGALAGSRGGEEVARPFDRRRRGPIIGEGAAAIALEPESAARERGGGPLWWLRAQVGAFDPTAPMTAWGHRSDALAEDLRRELGRQGVSIDGVDAVICGASGSVGGDRAEAEVLRALFGESMPPVLTPKALDAEHGGALLGGAMWLLDGGRFASPPGFGEPDPRCGVVPFGDDIPAPRRVLVGALAVGGAAAWMMLERIDD